MTCKTLIILHGVYTHGNLVTIKPETILLGILSLNQMKGVSVRIVFIVRC